MDGEATTEEPAIAGRLKRAHNLLNQLEGLKRRVTAITDRVCGSLPNQSTVGNDQTDRVYADNLVDNFLAIHDSIEREIAQIEVSVARISSQV